MLELHRHSLQMRSCRPAQKTFASVVLGAASGPAVPSTITQDWMNPDQQLVLIPLYKGPQHVQHDHDTKLCLTFLSFPIRDKRLILQMFHTQQIQKNLKTPVFVLLNVEQLHAIVFESAFLFFFITFLPCFIQHKHIFYLYFIVESTTFSEF